MAALARRKRLEPPNKLCLSCKNAEVSTEKGRLRIFCAQRHTSAPANCTDHSEAGTGPLLEAIRDRIRSLQAGYRKRFSLRTLDCGSCIQNCCTTPFLDRTPFYPEDEIYYLLCGIPAPNIPAGLNHCIFFNNGCTLPSDLRPHVCVEYKCIYLEDPCMEQYAKAISQATIDLLAVATRQYEAWRGIYRPEQSIAMRKRGLVNGKIYDRFDRVWNPDQPLEDLIELYGTAPAK